MSNKKVSKKNIEKDLDTSKKKYSEYSEGELFEGISIDSIVGQEDNCFIFLTVKDKKHKIVEITDDNFNTKDYIQKSNYMFKLHALIDLERFNEEEDRSLKGQLAYMYYSSLIDNNNDVKSFFETIETLINQAIDDIQESRHITFISCNIFHSFIAIILLLILYKIFNSWEYINSTLITIGGVIGSMLSIIQRNKETKKIHFRKRKNIILFSFISIILGALSGFIMYWGSQANILLGDMNNNISALFIIGIIAGTSERYLNSFLKKIEKNTTEDTN